MRSTDSAVLADEADDGLAAFNPCRWQGNDGGVIVRGELAAALVEPVVVEVVRVCAQELLGVATAEQQDAIGAPLAYWAYGPFRVHIAVGAARQPLRCEAAGVVVRQARPAPAASTR